MFSFSQWISSQKSVCESYKHLAGFQQDLATLESFESSEASKHSGLHSPEYWELALKDFKALPVSQTALQRISVAEWVSIRKEYHKTLSSVAVYSPTADRQNKNLSFFEGKALGSSDKLLPLEWERLYNECVTEYNL